ncbi:sulfur carrier protein ThiS [Herminiimonas aquatilis]|uniref:Sulfur carrier protein ThiS n=1 Tax=Herminiimonas aquatilis TaxID=345342 RepID=A0ABW2J3I1_9BURK
MEITIELNGASHRLTAHQNVEELIADLSLSGKAVAVAINRQIVPRSQWSQRQLQSSDHVDVVRAIGGG